MIQLSLANSGLAEPEKMPFSDAESTNLFRALKTEQNRLSFLTDVFANELVFDSVLEEHQALFSIVVNTISRTSGIEHSKKSDWIDLGNQLQVEIGKTNIRIFIREVYRVVKGISLNLREDLRCKHSSPFAVWLKSSATQEFEKSGRLANIYILYSQLHERANLCLSAYREKNLSETTRFLRLLEYSCNALCLELDYLALSS